MSSVDDTVNNKSEDFQRRLDAQTNRDQLAQCKIDLRDCRIDQCEGLVVIPELYVVTLIHKNKSYNAYINRHVTVGDIFRKMIALELLQNEDINTYQLIADDNAQLSLDLSKTLSNTNESSRYRIEPISKSVSERFFITIKTLTGKMVTINMCIETDTIAIIKERVLNEEGIPIDQQRLIFNGTQLSDDKTLGDYAITNGSILHLILRLRKPVIRLRSINNEIIKHVHVSVELDSHMWILSSIYPKASITDGQYFIHWNNMNVYPDGKIIFEENDESKCMIHQVYPIIDDEIEYRMLFWEALTIDSSYSFIQQKNLCVPRRDFARILNYMLKKMSLSSEDRDDLITYVLPQLDEVDPDNRKEKILFHFMSPDIYSKSAQLIVRPSPQQLVRAFLIYGFGTNDDEISKFDELENEIKNVFNTEDLSQSGLVVYEWGSMFVY